MDRLPKHREYLDPYAAAVDALAKALRDSPAMRLVVQGDPWPADWQDHIRQLERKEAAARRAWWKSTTRPLAPTRRDGQ